MITKVKNLSKKTTTVIKDRSLYFLTYSGLSVELLVGWGIAKVGACVGVLIISTKHKHHMSLFKLILIRRSIF